MRIVFMGTPDFAVPTLEALLHSHHEMIAVYSQPDKPKGRGQKLQPSPVKELALTHGVAVYQPLSFKDEEAVAELRSLAPDCIVVVAYGRILPQSVLDIPPHGCINVHGSLLPKYRGAAPIQWAVLNGETITGITTMYMGTGIDTGDMLLKEETPIGETETAGELFDRLKTMGAALLLKTLDALDTILPEKQDVSKATHAPMIAKEMSTIDWKKTATEISNQVRGLNPWPCASSVYCGKRMKLFSVKLLDRNGVSGSLFSDNGKLCVYCGKQALELVELQTENGKRMTGESFLLGHPINNDSHFERLEDR